MRPDFSLLDAAVIETIIDQARELLRTVGIEVHNARAANALREAGAGVDGSGKRTLFPDALVDRALSTAPREVRLFDARGVETHRFARRAVHYVPGSAALLFLDGQTGQTRRPITADYVRYVKVVNALPNFPGQSTAMVPEDVPEPISDSYRLYLGLRHSAKPVITGAFSVEGFGVMRDLLVAVRGGSRELAEKPLAMFTCCPSSPLKFGDAAENLLDCAAASIPIEVVSMPLAGLTAPVTPIGALIQHTAEVLSGVVLSQIARPATPVLFGSSLAIFDVRTSTTPLAAIESMMLGCGSAEIGRRLGLPTQAYMGLSDAKVLDMQAGLEASMGAVLAALTGINSVSGAGMHEFENCFSLEKLVIDHEICGMALRLVRGFDIADDVPVRPLIDELLREQHLVIADHTRRHLRTAIAFPSPLIDRDPRPRWVERGEQSIRQRARVEVERLERLAPALATDERLAQHLAQRMTAEARKHGMSELPESTNFTRGSGGRGPH
ncbi:MAG TPA: trimethylamine methyltransferase family protein [Gemmatimonadaceae bacterium]|nr:trimethylamine methyltransferase family protein [Gemmatimonadaceae bacterium]